MRWAILAVVAFVGCGQAAATAPVAVQPSASIVATQPVDAAFVAENTIAQLPAGPSPRGWSVAFTGGPLDGQTRIVPRIYSTHPHSVGMSGGTHFLATEFVIVNVYPSHSRVSVAIMDGGGYGHVDVPGGGTSFSGTGTFAGPTGPTGFSATVTAIP